MTTPGARLRAAWQAGPIMIPGAFNALTARLAERLGFPAVYLSGGALSAGWAGLPDIGLLTQTEFAEQAAVLARATALPVLCDADTGFGEAIHVERTIRLYEEAGAAGLHLEDQVLPKRCGHLSGKGLVEPQAMAAKIRAAVAARRDPDFVIVARTDARTVEGFDAAVRRAHDYLAAGADMIFPEALESVDEFARFAREVRAPLAGQHDRVRPQPADPVRRAGSAGIPGGDLSPDGLPRRDAGGRGDALRALREHGTQRELLDRMQSRAELYDLLGYSDWERRDQAYFTAGVTDTADRPGP